MQSTSPRHNFKKLKHPTAKGQPQLSFAKKNNPQSKSKATRHIGNHSQPETPRYLHLKPDQTEESQQFLRTVSLTNTLIKAVENQKQILKNIKTISAQILKNKKDKRKQEEDSQQSLDANKFYFPMKSTNNLNNHPHTLYGIEERLSHDDSEPQSNFDEYCLLNTTKPKIQKKQQQNLLSPKQIIIESRSKKKKKFKKNDKNNSLKGSRERSWKLHSSKSLKKSKMKIPSSPKYMYRSSSVEKKNEKKK